VQIGVAHPIDGRPVGGERLRALVREGEHHRVEQHGGRRAQRVIGVEVTAAADLDPARSSTNVATLSFIALLGFLVGPPLIGFIGQHVDLRVGVAALLPILAVSLVLSGRLSRTTTAPTAIAQGEA